MVSFKESQVIENINQHNYCNWKYNIDIPLIKKIIIETLPATITCNWRKKKDNKARALINLLIDDSQIAHIKKQTTARVT